MPQNSCHAVWGMTTSYWYVFGTNKIVVTLCDPQLAQSMDAEL